MNPILEILQKRSNTPSLGIASYCTANEYCIEALLRRAKETNTPVLIEATANQVNQFGGYTGMKPADFSNFVLGIAQKVGCPKQLVMLGGDHLGPLTFQKDDEKEAMEKSKELVRQYVEAGFVKIHLDTSMKLASDAKDAPLSTEVIAKRGAELYDICIKTFEKMDDANKMRPVFIIGSEVPIPGGATEVEDSLQVTKVADFKDTIDTYHRVFSGLGYENALDDIVAVVVQPGVEFGDSQVFLYNREKAAPLSAALKEYKALVLEGHSTDYQTKECLKEMVEDGVAILKVGPAITFRLREALCALSFIEQELVDERDWANFAQVLDDAMLEEPGNWQNHYHGSERTRRLARRYSYSDRCRYYLGVPKVKDSMNKLLQNLSELDIPMNILHQYFPAQYEKVMRGTLSAHAYELLMDAILEVADEYEYATGLL